ncbi:MAG: hypothetical protein ABIA78_03850 [archaeon]
MTCVICGAEARVYDVICSKGIVKACVNCIQEEDLPLVRKSAEVSSGASSVGVKKPSVYERMSKMSGVEERDIKSASLRKEDTTLKDIVNRNFELKIKNVKPEKRDDLVDNFHWILMRARRLKHVSPAQIAKAIGEPEMAIKMAEKGVLPNDYLKFMKKMQDYLGAKLLKVDVSKIENNQIRSSSGLLYTSEISELGILDESRGINFDSQEVQSLTISDLQEMKKKRGEEIVEEDEKVIISKKNASENEVEFEEKAKKDLSEDEINDLIFGRK